MRNKNQTLVPVFSLIFLLILSSIVKFKSTGGIIIDWLVFFNISYFIIVASMKIIKRVNEFDLSDDLTIWGLRLGGAIFFGLGLFFMAWGSMTIALLAMREVSLISTYSLLLAAFCLIIIGAFCEFRSQRRYPVIYIRQI